MLQLFLEVLIVSGIGYTFITQLLMPVIRGTKLFPIFRREGRLRSEITDLNQIIIENDLNKQIEKTIKKERL